MTDPNAALLAAFDGHMIDGVRTALDAGAAVHAPIDGKPATDWLLEEYHRTDRLPACLLLLLDRGAALSDPALAPILLDDADAVRADPGLLTHRTTPSAPTPAC